MQVVYFTASDAYASRLWPADKGSIKLGERGGHGKHSTLQGGLVASWGLDHAAVFAICASQMMRLRTLSFQSQNL